MYKELIRSIQSAVAFNLDNADKGDVERSYFTAGEARGYLSVLRMIGHNVEHGTWNDNGCDRIGFIEIDGVVLVKNSEIDFNAYGLLLNK